MPEKEEAGKLHGRSAQLQALPQVNGSARQENKEGALSALFPYELILFKHTRLIVCSLTALKF
jgi:hypothetical protein